MEEPTGSPPRQGGPRAPADDNPGTMSLGKLLGVVPDANPSSPSAHHGDEGPPVPDLSFMGHGDEIQLTDFKLARSIAVVTWGALAWDPRELPLVCDDEERPEEAWHPGGPELPIEFSRVAVDCRLIPVLDPANGVPVSTLWARSRRNDLNAAVEDLMKAEGARNRKLIGFVDTKDNTHRCLAHMAMAEPVKAWARGHGVDCVIWAELPPNFANHTGRPFSLDTAMRYLGELPRALVEQAREYVNRTPACVDTPLRRKLAELGWPGLG